MYRDSADLHCLGTFLDLREGMGILAAGKGLTLENAHLEHLPRHMSRTGLCADGKMLYIHAGMKTYTNNSSQIYINT